MAWLYKQTGSDNWWLGYRSNGKQYLRSLRTPNRQEADRELAKVRALYEAQKADTLTEEVFQVLTGKTNHTRETLKGAMEMWLTECSGDLSAATTTRYRGVARDFYAFLNADDTRPLLKDIQQDNIAEFLRAKRALTSPQTAKLTRRILSGFFNYAAENNMITANPVPSAQSLKLTGRAANDAHKRRPLTLAELKTVYDKAPSDFWRYMVLAGFFLGQRMGDLICLTWGSVDFKDNVVRLVQSKTRKTVVVPLHPALRTRLDPMKRAAGKTSTATPLWPKEAERYRKYGSGPFSNEFYDDVLHPSGLVPKRHKNKRTRKDDDKHRQVSAVSFHSLRHTFVSLLKATGSTQAVAKELAGHSSDTMSNHYTALPADVLSQAVKQLSSITKEEE